jgi:hypothetical protein
LGSRDVDFVPFGTGGAVIGVIDATMLVGSTPSSGVISGIAGGAAYPEASVMSTGLAPLSTTALTVGLTEAAPGGIREVSAKRGQPRIPMMAAATKPVIASERKSLESLIWIFENRARLAQNNLHPARSLPARKRRLPDEASSASSCDDSTRRQAWY